MNTLSARAYLIAAHLGIRPSDLNPVEAHELTEAFDQMNEIRTSPGQDRSRGHASETRVIAGPDTEPTPDHASGPGTSRTVEHSGAGRTPVLPTEPFTVIRVHYFDPPWDSELMLLPDGQWWTPGATGPLRPETLPIYITGFKVISKPVDPDHFDAEDPISARVRRETERAVYWFVQNELRGGLDTLGVAAAIAREFGIDA